MKPKKISLIILPIILGIWAYVTYVNEPDILQDPNIRLSQKVKEQFAYGVGCQIEKVSVGFLGQDGIVTRLFKAEGCDQTVTYACKPIGDCERRPASH